MCFCCVLHAVLVRLCFVYRLCLSLCVVVLCDVCCMSFVVCCLVCGGSCVWVGGCWLSRVVWFLLVVVCCVLIAAC